MRSVSWRRKHPKPMIRFQGTTLFAIAEILVWYVVIGLSHRYPEMPLEV
jgi:hypothetical protein